MASALWSRPGAAATMMASGKPLSLPQGALTSGPPKTVHGVSMR